MSVAALGQLHYQKLKMIAAGVLFLGEEANSVCFMIINAFKAITQLWIAMAVIFRW